MVAKKILHVYSVKKKKDISYSFNSIIIDYSEKTKEKTQKTENKAPPPNYYRRGVPGTPAILHKNNIMLDLSIPQSYPFKPYSIKNCNIKFKNKHNTYFRNIYMLNEARNKIYDSNILTFFYKIQYGINPRFLNLNTNDCFC